MALVLLLTGMLSLPLLSFAGAMVRAVLLFWPTMVFLGAVHSHLDWVPNLGWQATFLVVALLGLLIPTGNTASND